MNMAEIKEVEILLVEDNLEDQELTLRALKKRNLSNRIHSVADGAEALDFLFGQGAYAGRTRADAPKLVLLDIKLPRVNGIEVLRKVKADPDLRMVPIVMLTSSKEGPDIQECYRLGANSYIVKPVDFDKFTEAVVQLGFYWLLTNQPAR
jgi:two-component system response regulator